MDVTLISAVPFIVMCVPMGCAAFSASMKRYPMIFAKKAADFFKGIPLHAQPFRLAGLTSRMYYFFFIHRRPAIPMRPPANNRTVAGSGTGFVLPFVKERLSNNPKTAAPF
jgi:hypothetical protein